MSVEWKVHQLTHLSYPISAPEDICSKNRYPISSIDECFKTFLNRVYLKRPQVLTAEKKMLTLVLPFLGKCPFKPGEKVLKRTLSSSKIQILFKNQINLAHVFCFQDCLPYDLMSCVVYKLQYGRCNASYYGETELHLKIRLGEHIGISPLAFKKLSHQPRVQYVTTFCFVIMTPDLVISPSWLRGLISFC